MPSPEELGIAGPAPLAQAGSAWASAYRRLDELGVRSLHLEKSDDGGWRVSCLLPTGQPGRTHRIDAQAGTAEEALQLALSRAEQWAGRKSRRGGPGVSLGSGGE